MTGARRDARGTEPCRSALRWPFAKTTTMEQAMQQRKRNDMRDQHPDDSGRRGWLMPLALLVALALGGLIYAFSDGSNTTASNNAPTTSRTTTGSGGGTGLTGEQTGAAVTQTPAGAATGGGGAASR
jgi:uncharacterized protein HemX